jgi:hypothetical protein
LILKDRDNREVEVEFEFNRDGSAYIASGYYVDTGDDAPEEVLYWMDTAYEDVLAEVSFEDALRRAEDWADRDR